MNFLETISAKLGHPITPFNLDGKFYHFGKDKPGRKPLWAIGHSWEYKGNTYWIVNFGDFQTGESFAEKSYELKDQTKQFKDKHKAAVKELEETVNWEKEEKHQACRTKWAHILSNIFDSDEVHPYLAGKQITSNFSARIGNSGQLIIPIYSDAGLEGAQIISDGKKIFSTGIKIKGSFTKINDFDLKTADYIYLTEGFATGCSVFLATQTNTVCCFTAGNLGQAITTIRQINPNLKIIIAADDDFQTKGNPGIMWAKRAVNLHSNVIIRTPKFSTRINETDFNDLHILDGLDIVKDQLGFSKSDFVEIISLGHCEDKFYYLSTQTLKITALSAAAHTPNTLLAMAENKYWGDRYGFKKDKQGELTHFANFDLVIEKLFAEQREKGFFNPENIRGLGAWIDGKDVVVNMGDKLMVNGRSQAITSYKSKYFYQAGLPIDVDLENILSAEEGQRVINVFQKLCYKSPGDFVYLCGWIALAQIPGAIEWRPHIWLTGERGSGKTEILRAVAGMVFNSEIMQNLTAAGIKQYLKINSMPMILDEVEPNNIDSQRRMDAIIELIRQTSSRTQTRSLRGGTDGKANSYVTSSIFCLSSIQVYLPTSADISRFHVIEMMATKGRQSQEEWKKIRSEFNDFYNLSKPLFARMVTLIPIIRQNVDAIKDYLAKNYPQLDSRSRDQTGTSIAGFWALTDSGFIGAEEIEKIVQKIDLNREDNNENDDMSNDSENCLRAILELIPHKLGKSIARTIADCMHDGQVNLRDSSNLMLGDYGIRVMKIEKMLFISSNNTQLKAELRGGVFLNYASFLKRHPAVIGKGAVRINGKIVFGMKISLDAAYKT